MHLRLQPTPLPQPELVLAVVLVLAEITVVTNAVHVAELVQNDRSQNLIKKSLVSVA
jgi:hypothetical protein